MTTATRTHVTAQEARTSKEDFLARWAAADPAERAAVINGIRFTELRGGAILALLAEEVDEDREARRAGP